MIYQHTLQQVNDYFEHQGINQGALKVLIGQGGVQAYLDRKEELLSKDDLVYETEKKHLLVGSGVDCKLTHMEGDFKELYFVSTLIKKPGDKAMKVLKRAFDLAKEAYPNGPDADMMLYKLQLFMAANEEQYYMNLSKDKTHENDDSRVASLVKQNGVAYWVDLCVADGKQILSDTESTTIDDIEMAMRTHKHSSWLFIDAPDIDIIYQMPLYFTLDDVDCKGMVDQIRINHTQKRIFIIDFKTIGDYIIKFPHAVDIRRYDIQGAFYTEGVKRCLEQISDLIGKDVRTYSIANFAFAAESSVRPGTPLIWVLKQDMMDRGKVGGLGKNGYRYVGYDEALTKFKAWSDEEFSLDRHFSNTNGVILLGTDYDMNINL